MKTATNNQLAPESKVWIYQSSRGFTPDETRAIAQRTTDFVSQWTAHKLEVTGSGLVLYNRFIVLMADETQVGVSGCSIDSSVNFIRSLGHELNANFFDRWNIAYKNADEEVQSCHRNVFEKLVQTGVVHDETIVFNNLVATKADFETKWQIAYKDSWLKNLSAAHTSFNSIL